MNKIILNKYVIIILFLVSVININSADIMKNNSNENLFQIYTKDYRYGFIDINGKVNFILDKRFKYASSFSEGLSAVIFIENDKNVDKKNNSYIIDDYYKNQLLDRHVSFPGEKCCGYIDKKGELVILPQFGFASNFKEGLALVGTSKNDNFGFINKEGKIIIPLKYKYALSFSDGLAVVKINEKFGYLDKKGKIVIKPQFNNAHSFSSGRAFVTINNQMGYIDKTGKMIIKLNKYITYAEDFHEGLAAVAIGGEDWEKPFDGRGEAPPEIEWGFIDLNGNYIVQHQYSDVSFFSESVVMIESGSKSGGFILDKYGKIFKELPYEMFWQSNAYFSDGLLMVKEIGTGKTGYINKNGTYIIKPMNYGKCMPFVNGLAFFWGHIEGQFGYINKKGYVVWKSK